ncbi:hypothetical protein PQX77_005107 [Marasmius sp. AFHP31]|nr:hypothetical protein PQX77_005107 [Marasmius sp. AFHP31]
MDHMAKSVVNKPLGLEHPCKAIDGQVGAWVEDGKYFVTSPNTLLVYKPLLGTREVALRQDYYLGAEDPLLYPQPFILDRCHLAAIPRRPTDSKTPLAKWWTSLPPSSFINEPDTMIKGLGRWSGDSLRTFADDSYQLHACIEKYRSSLDSSARPNGLITALDKHLGQTLRHIKTMPLPYHRARQLWSFFQRWYLELAAALDWVEVYAPIMNGRSAPSDSSREKAKNTMGAFLVNTKDCEHFYSADIPFWFIRSAEHHPTVRVEMDAILITPESLQIQMEDIMSHQRDVIYTGSLQDVRKAIATEQFGMAIVNYSNNPFSVPPTQASTTSSSELASSAGPSRGKKTNRQRHEPYKGGKPKPKSQPQVERDKFTEIRGPFSPDVPDVWVEALSSLDKNRRPARTDIPNSGYAFPDPGMILFCPKEKRERLLRNWLQLRPVLMFRLCMKPCQASGAWSPKQWRLVLGTTDDHVPKEGSQMADQRAAVQQLLAQCLDFYGLSYVKQDPNHFTWRDKRSPIGLLSDTRIVREIIWELFELNFRMEFHALDRLFNPDEESYSPEVQACFGRMEGISHPTQVEVKHANSGPAAAEAKHRFWYFRRMCGVMKRWPGGMHSETFFAEKDKFKDFSDAEVTAMERWVTKFYCQTFFEKFGRPPIIPHRLD